MRRDNSQTKKLLIFGEKAKNKYGTAKIEKTIYFDNIQNFLNFF